MDRFKAGSGRRQNLLVLMTQDPDQDPEHCLQLIIIEVNFLFKKKLILLIDCVQYVLFLTAKCRYTLQYTYPFAYYIQPSPRKELVSIFITYFKPILPYKKLSDTIAAASTCAYSIFDGT